MAKGRWIHVQICLALGVMLTILTGCGNKMSHNIADVFIEQMKIETFSGKGIQKEYIDGKLVQSTRFTEWKGKDRNYRINVSMELSSEYYETYSGTRSEKATEEVEIQYIYSDDKVLIYYPQENKYVIKSVSLNDDVEAVLTQGINSLLVNGSAKTFTMSVISELSQDYTLSIEDDVKVNGRNTQHIIAVGKQQDNSNDRQEYWIDQQNWMVVKNYEQRGNYSIEFEYTDYQLNPRIDEKIFDTTLAEGAKISYIGNNLNIVDEEINLSAAPKRLGTSIYYLERDEKIHLISAKYIEMINEAKGIIQLTYKLSDGREVIVEDRPFYSLYSRLDLGYEKIDLDGTEAEYYAEDKIKMIQFTGEDVICDIYVKNSEISKEELISLAKKLKLLKK